MKLHAGINKKNKRRFIIFLIIECLLSSWFFLLDSGSSNNIHHTSSSWPSSYVISNVIMVNSFELNVPLRSFHYQRRSGTCYLESSRSAMLSPCYSRIKGSVEIEGTYDKNSYYSSSIPYYLSRVPMCLYMSRSATTTATNSASEIDDVQVTDRQDIWKTRFQDLLKYKSRHGDCFVPREYKRNPSLGKWVVQQRKCYKEYNEQQRQQHMTPTKKSPLVINFLDEERIKALDEVGFVWNVAETRWNIKYKELKHFKDTHNNSTLVPASYKKNPALGKWVSVQRKQYSLGKMPQNRIDLLNELQFSWDLNSLGALSDSRWNKRYKQLQEYKAKYGHVNVPLNYEENPKLGIWVCNQRLFYQYKEKDTELGSRRGRYLKDERMKKLNEIGFVWDRNNRVWNDKYNMLKEYKKKYGDCLVPQDYEENPKLGRWVVNQRVQYKRVVEKDKNTNEKPKTFLSETKIQLLDNIEFCWNVEELKFNQMLKAVKDYYDEHGDFDIPTTDNENVALRRWITYQRQQYILLTNEENPSIVPKGRKSTLTPERRKALDEIDFVWTNLKTRNKLLKQQQGILEKEGPSTEDWSLLFDKMKESGIKADGEMKKHILDGEKRSEEKELEDLEDLDDDALMDLWNAEDDDW